MRPGPGIRVLPRGLRCPAGERVSASAGAGACVWRGEGGGAGGGRSCSGAEGQGPRPGLDGSATRLSNNAWLIQLLGSAGWRTDLLLPLLSPPPLENLVSLCPPASGEARGQVRCFREVSGQGRAPCLPGQAGRHGRSLKDRGWQGGGGAGRGHASLGQGPPAGPCGFPGSLVLANEGPQGPIRSSTSARRGASLCGTGAPSIPWGSTRFPQLHPCEAPGVESRTGMSLGGGWGPGHLVGMGRHTGGSPSPQHSKEGCGCLDSP